MAWFISEKILAYVLPVIFGFIGAMIFDCWIKKKRNGKKTEELIKTAFQDGYTEAKSEIVSLLNMHKETCMELAKKYAEQFNADKTNVIAMNNYNSMGFAYNELEDVLSEIEDRAQTITLFT